MAYILTYIPTAMTANQTTITSMSSHGGFAGEVVALGWAPAAEEEEESELEDKVLDQGRKICAIGDDRHT